MLATLGHVVALEVSSTPRSPRLGPPRPQLREGRGAHSQVLAAWGARERDASNPVLGAVVKWAALEGCADAAVAGACRDELRATVGALQGGRTRFHADVSGLERLLATCQRRRRRG